MKYSYNDITMQDVEKLYQVPGAFALRHGDDINSKK